MKRPNSIDNLRAAFAQIEATRFAVENAQAIDQAVIALGELFGVPLQVEKRLANGLIGVHARKIPDQDLQPGFGPFVAALLNEVPTTGNPAAEEPVSGKNFVIPQNSWAYLSQPSLLHVLQRAIELHPLTIYVTSLDHPDQSLQYASWATIEFDPEMMTKSRPKERAVYKMQLGALSGLALEEMLEHADKISRELYVKLREMPETPALNTLLQASPWQMDSRGNVTPKPQVDRFFHVKQAVRALDDAQNAGKPVQVGQARGKALVEGLMALAKACGKTIKNPLAIDANGELNFAIDNDWPRNPDVQGYGIELAAWLGEVPRRTGEVATQCGVLPENNWCRLNHFDAEKLLRAVAANPERTIYVPSLRDAGLDDKTCMPPSFTFKPSWMTENQAGSRPIYKIEPGRTPVLAIEEMKAHAHEMSPQMFEALQQRLESAPELKEVLNGAPWGQDVEHSHPNADMTP